MAYREKDTKKWTAQWFETNVMGEKKKRRKRGFETKRERLQIFWIMKMEMLLPDWDKKEMNVEKAKEKAQINNLSKFSDNQIH